MQLNDGRRLLKPNQIINNIGRAIQRRSSRALLRTKSRFVDSHKLSSLVDHDTLFEFVLPVDRHNQSLLPQCVNAVSNQQYENWRLRIVTSCNVPEVEGIPWDHRIGVEASDGLSWINTVNKTISTSTATFVSIMTPNVILEPDALLWASLEAREQPDANWFYFDYLKSDISGRTVQPIANPDFSCEHLLCRWFTGPLNFYRQSLLQQVNGLQADAKSATLYDLALRISDAIWPLPIHHIPEFAYTEIVIGADRGDDSKLIAIESAYKRRSIPVTLKIQGNTEGDEIHLPVFHESGNDEVTIAIPTRNQRRLLKKCVEDVRRTAGYSNYRIVVIDNRSDDPRMRDFFECQRRIGQFDVFEFDEPFNYARMHNELLRQIDSPFVILLNNDVYDFSADWVRQLVGTANLSQDIGCVGALLRYPNGMTQHGGVTFGIGKPCRHAHLGVHADELGYAGRLQTMQELSAVTAALMLVRREVFLEVGGFDEVNFPISYNDTDFCLTLKTAGYRSIFNPAVTAVHEESISRGKSPLEREWRRRFEEKWGATIATDRFYSPHLSHRNFEIDPLWKTTWRIRRKLSLAKKITQVRLLD